MIHIPKEDISTDISAIDSRIQIDLERYKVVLENMVDIMSIHHLDGRTVWVSESVRDLLGHHPGNVISRKFKDFIHPDDIDGFNRLWKRVEDGMDGRARFRMKNREGVDIWMEGRARPLFNGQPGPIAILMRIRDVRETVALEDQLRLQLGREETAWNGAPIGLCIVNKNGGFVRVNPRACEIWGYTSKQLESMTFQQITYPEDLGKDLGLLNSLIAGEIPSYSIFKRYIRSDGTIIYCRLSVSAVRSISGELEYFISHVEDITKDFKLQAELQEELAFHDAIFDQSIYPMATFDNKGRFRKVNKAWEKFIGYSSEELAGITYRQVTPDEDKAYDEKLLARLQEGANVVEEVKCFLRKDGTKVEAFVFGGVVTNEDHEIMWMMVQAKKLKEIHKLSDEHDARTKP